MCGLCGYLKLKTAGYDLDDRLLARMTDVLEHRGPDDRGTWTDGRIALGSRRLSVIDLSRAGRQPMKSEDGTIHLVYNGEVYNFSELRKRYRLDERGHIFRSGTDTEVLLHLFEELGTAMFSELNGMFALAIWDARDGKLHLARDRYGIKPLFYYQDGEHFRFASEIKAILKDPKIPRRPNIQALHDYLTFNYVPGPQTAFEGILEVPPAHSMTVDVEGNRKLHQYWDLQFEANHDIDEARAVEGARELMERAIRRRLIADVPIGVLLSGGLDSSTCVAFMDRHTDGAVHTYSVGFEDQSFNELPYARVVADAFQTVHREVVVTADTVRDLLRTYLSQIDEPYADGSAIPTYCVCEIASDEVVVVLSGEGGDEVFAGYDTYAAHKAMGWYRRVPRWIRQGLIAPLARALPVSDKKLSFEFRLKRFVAGQDLPADEAHLWWRIVLTEAQKLAVYSPDVRERFAAQPSLRHFRDGFQRSAAEDELSKLMYIDSRVFLPDDLMIKNDRMSMAHSLEARVPFTDPELVEFMATVPARLKMPGLSKKRLMKEAMQGLLPERIISKKKVGLEMPYSQWLRDELRGTLDEYLSPETLHESGLFDAVAVARLVQDHMERRADNGRVLWGLLNYMVWLDLYIGG